MDTHTYLSRHTAYFKWHFVSSTGLYICENALTGRIVCMHLKTTKMLVYSKTDFNYFLWLAFVTFVWHIHEKKFFNCFVYAKSNCIEYFLSTLWHGLIFCRVYWTLRTGLITSFMSLSMMISNSNRLYLVILNTLSTWIHDLQNIFHFS